MPTNVKVTPKDFFLWLGAVIALYASVGALIGLLFQYINYAFPDPLGYGGVDPYSGGIRFAMATLIVMAPVAVLLFRFIRKDIAQTPAKADLWVRRWAIVLTVFLAGFIVVGDLITLINYFLGGELTTRFILKVLVVLLVAGGVFLHFLADLRGYWTANPSRAQMVGLGAGALVFVSIVSGFFIMGTPGEVRLLRYDREKVSDLQSMQWQIVNYYQQKGTLPTDVSQVEDSIGGYRVPQDPQTGEPYEYRRTGDLSFEICATFNKPSRDLGREPVARPIEFGVESENWQHPEGRHCFERTIDPDRYPIIEKRVVPVTPAP